MVAPQDREDSRCIPQQDVPSSGGNAAKEEHGGAVGISPSGLSNSSGGDISGGYMCNPLPEHHPPVYRDLSNTGSMYGRRTTSGKKGVMMVVGSVLYITMNRNGGGEGGWHGYGGGG